MPAFASAAADGAAVIFTLGSGARFRMEYPPVLHAKPPRGVRAQQRGGRQPGQLPGGGRGGGGRGGPRA